MDWTPESLREARESRNLTQQQLADAIQASLKAVNNWETGASAISRRFQRELTRYFSAAPTAIEDDDDDEPRLSKASATQFAAELLRRLVEAEQATQLLRVRRGELPADLFSRPNIILGPTTDDNPNHGHAKG